MNRKKAVISLLSNSVDGIEKSIDGISTHISNLLNRTDVSLENIGQASPVPLAVPEEWDNYDGLLEINRHGIIQSVETQLLDLLGYERENILGKNARDFIPVHMLPFINKGWQELLANEEPLKVNGLHSKGFEIPLHIRVERGNNGDDTFFIKIKDVSYRKKIEEELLSSRENYQILAETATDAIVQINSKFTITFANSAVLKIFGYQRLEIENQQIDILFPPSRYGSYEKQFEKYFYIDDTHREDTGLQNSLEVLGKKKNGDLIPLEISFGNSRGEHNNRKLTCIIRDIASRKKTERHLKYLAYHDKLTSLGNRDRLNESLDQVLLELDRYPDRKAALLFLDLDGFKKVNDSLGHEMGDAILKECSKRLTNCLRQGDQVYRFQMQDIFRLGGDEFTILLPFINRPEDAAIVARRIIGRILEPFNIEGYGSITHINMGVSVGIALIPQDGSDRTTILRNADAAMYKAKELGNQYVFFTPDMNNRAIERLLIEEGLRKSLGSESFTLHYQPITSPEGKAVGCEALIRWLHPEEGLIPPEKFITIAEDTSLILPIGRWVLETACRHTKQWLEMGMTDFYVSINISAKQLEQGGLGDIVREITKKVGIDPKYLALELTETCIMGDPEKAIAHMQDIIDNNPGIRIAIDDFGTGYSSLSYLSRFPVKHLKIDKSFVISLDKENNRKIINAIITLATSLNLTIVAEGVETEENRNYLKDRGCNLFQGNLFSKPVPFNQITKILKNEV